MSKESNHSSKGLINIQNTDENEYLKSCLVKYLHPLATNLGRIRKIDIKFPVKIKDVHKIDKKWYQS